MHISTLSKHLPAVIQYIQTPLGDYMLEIVHLAESARYHSINLDRLIAGEGSAPPGFQAGVDFRGNVLDSHWRIMASWIEFEAFLSAGKRCLDRAWCCLGDRLGEKGRKTRTLAGAIYKLKKENKNETIELIFNGLPYFLQLKSAWDTWGQELADLRNYVEHQAPLGGRSCGYTQITEEGDINWMFVPDEIPRSKEDIPKQNLTFNKCLTADAYAHHVMKELDDLVGNLLWEGRTLEYI